MLKILLYLLIKIDAKIKYSTREFNSNTEPEDYDVTTGHSPTVLEPENGFSQQMDALQIYAYGMFQLIAFIKCVY